MPGGACGKNIAFREHLNLWGDTPRRLPDRFTQCFPASDQATKLFDDALPRGSGLQALPAADPHVLLSVPERAMLELLSDVGKVECLAEARELVESLSGLRERVLDELLRHTTRIKVVRMAAALAGDMNLPWARSRVDIACALAAAHGGSPSAGTGTGWICGDHEPALRRHGSAQKAQRRPVRCAAPAARRSLRRVTEPSPKATSDIAAARRP